MARKGLFRIINIDPTPKHPGLAGRPKALGIVQALDGAKNVAEQTVIRMSDLDPETANAE